MKTVLWWAVAALAAACTATGVRSREVVAAFPAGWSGTWRGTLEVCNADGALPGASVEHVIEPTEDPARWRWVTTYDGAAGRVVKDYTLLVRDALRGAYAIDERDGVVLEARWLGDALHTWFEVGGSLLIVRESVLANGTAAATYCFELLTAPTATAADGDGAVRCFAPVVLQRARLRRVR
ncbi:MAG: hypothetical protein JNM25_12705 [Planctomycetes bacterium]|nr:hypothetical protein [Planctomycetota bacterium]